VDVPSPNLLEKFEPQHLNLPSAITAHVCMLPDEIEIAGLEEVIPETITGVL
jgi:hypothetical protein